METPKGSLVIIEREHSEYRLRGYGPTSSKDYLPAIVTSATCSGLAKTYRPKIGASRKVQSLHRERVYGISPDRLSGLSPAQALARLESTYDTLEEVRNAVRNLATLDTTERAK